MRKIIHIDMDAFFASVEQRDNPVLRGKPIAVGFDGPRGVVSTASYEARRFGVHSAMSIAKAKQMCRDLIIVPSRFEAYKDVSRQIHGIFHRYTDIIEPISLDEAFLDVTENKKGIELAVDIARKPDGLFTIHPDRALDFIANLPIEDFWGVGPKTLQTMHRIGIFNGRQLRECSLKHLTEVFGKAGPMFHDFARGIDNRPVESIRIRKSVGCEQTFLEDLTLKSAVIIELYHTVQELIRRLEKSGFRGKTLTLKVKYADFTQVTRSLTQSKVLRDKDDILPLAKQLLAKVDFKEHPFRLLGLSVSRTDNDQHEEPRQQWHTGELPFEPY